MCARSMIGISHLLRRVSQVWVTIGALVQQLILLMASYSSKWDFYRCPSLPSSPVSFLLRSTVFGCSRNFVSCPRSLCSVHLIASFSCVSPFHSCFSFFPSIFVPLSLTFNRVAPLYRTENTWPDVATRVHTSIYPRANSPTQTGAISNRFTKISKKKSCYHCTPMETLRLS